MTCTDPESCLQQADPEHFYSCGGGDGGGGGGGRGGGGGGGGGGIAYLSPSSVVFQTTVITYYSRCLTVKSVHFLLLSTSNYIDMNI